jgi:hypothetical protein
MVIGAAISGDADANIVYLSAAADRSSIPVSGTKIQ